MSKIQFFLSQISTKLWLRPTLYSVVATLWVGAAYMAHYIFPKNLPVDIDHSTLVNILSILASTMLTVATFSVSAVAGAFGSVAASATPRATRIVMSDTGVQSTLAAFLAAFIFAIVGITALSAVPYDKQGRFFLFLGFVVMVGWVLMSFLNWVDRVSRLGKLEDTTERVVDAVFKSIDKSYRFASDGAAVRYEKSPPKDSQPIYSSRSGYVQYLDIGKMNELAEENDFSIWLDVVSGDWTHDHDVLCYVVGTNDKVSEEWTEIIQKSVVIDTVRTIETDPRFAMTLLAEIADRALSPGVNDPGTAISMITEQTHILETIKDRIKEITEEQGVNAVPRYPRVQQFEINYNDVFEAAFHPIARDGAGNFEVMVHLQTCLRALSDNEVEDIGEAALKMQEMVNFYAQENLPIAEHRERIEQLMVNPVKTDKDK